MSVFSKPENKQAGRGQGGKLQPKLINKSGEKEEQVENSVGSPAMSPAKHNDTAMTPVQTHPEISMSGNPGAPNISAKNLTSKPVPLQQEETGDEEKLDLKPNDTGLTNDSEDDETGLLQTELAAPAIQRQQEEPSDEEKIDLKPISESTEKNSDEDESPTIQTKLSIGQPGDKYEKEADQMANHVVNQVGKPTQGIQKQGEDKEKEDKVDLKSNKISSAIQREAKFPDISSANQEVKEAPKKEKEKEKKEEDKTKSDKGLVDIPIPTPVEEKKPPEISTKSDSSGTKTSVPQGLESNLKNSKGGGESMEPGVKSQMESGFGRDFSSVRVHKDSNAVQMNKNLNAKAFTNKQDIYFNQGEYAPGSTAGKQLLAHELTHTVQQGSSGNGVQKLEKPERTVIAEPKPANPHDGSTVKGLTDSKIKNDPDFDEDAPKSKSAMTEEDKKKAKPDKGKVRAKNAEVQESGDAKVKPDRGGKAKEKSEVQKEQIKTQVNKKPKTAEGKKGKGKNSKKENLSEAGAAAQKSKQALANAKEIVIPEKPEPFKHPTIDGPVDSEGQPLPRKPDVDTQVRGLGYIGEMLRDYAYRAKKYAMEKIMFAFGLEASLEKQKEDFANAKEGTQKIKEHTEGRKEINEKSKGALKESEDKQQFVAEKAPEMSQEAGKGMSDSGDLAKESSEKAEKAKSEIPEDEDARKDAEKQSAEMNESSDGSEKLNKGIEGAKDRSDQYMKDAQFALGKNAESGAQITETQGILAETGKRISEMEAKNEQSKVKLEEATPGPETIRKASERTAQSSDQLIEASYVMELEINDIQTNYFAGMKSIESKEVAQKRIEEEEKESAKAQATPDELQVMELAGLDEPQQKERVEAMDESEQKKVESTMDKMITLAPDNGTDASEGKRFEVKTGLNEAIMGEPEADPRAPEIGKVDAERVSRLGGVLDIADKNMVFLSVEEKAMLADKLVGESITDGIKNINILQIGKGMIQGMIDPRMALTGAIDGFEKMLGGFANIGNWEAWKKDPLGNLLQIGADIATGLAMIFSSVLGIAAIIMALMVAITIISWGFALPVTGPVMTWMGTVMTYAGWGAIISGALSVYYNSLAYIKNLYDASTAETSRELFGNVGEMKQNATDGFTGAMAIVEGIGAAKMGPALKSGAAIKQIPKSPGEFFSKMGKGIKSTAGAIKDLPANLVRGAKRLMAGGKQGLIKFKDKIKGWFKRKKTTKADAGAPPGKVTSSKEKALGSFEGKKVQAEVEMPGGHKKKVLNDGQCVTCSKCQTTRNRFKNELSNPTNKKLLDDLNNIEARLKHKPDNKSLLRRQSQIEKQLQQLRDMRWKNVSRKEFIADYRAKYPNSKLTDADLMLRHKKGMRLNPASGSLKKPKRWDDPQMTKKEFIEEFRIQNPKSKLSNKELGDNFLDGNRLDPKTGKFKRPPNAKLNSYQKGRIGEKAMDVELTSQGYVNLTKASKGPQGIDGVFAKLDKPGPPPVYKDFLVVESKYGTSKVSTTVTSSGGSQMTKPWINNNLPKAVDANVLGQISTKGYSKKLSHYNPSTKKVTISPL
jgi:hypothetical protein